MGQIFVAFSEYPNFKRNLDNFGNEEVFSNCKNSPRLSPCFPPGLRLDISLGGSASHLIYPLKKLSNTMCNELKSSQLCTA